MQKDLDIPFRILHLEDSPFDAELIENELQKGNILFEKSTVDNKKDFEEALKEFLPDIVLSDHSLPSFDSIEALKIVKNMGIKVPFILITSAISEEFAVEIMRKGAYDYILKDRLQRLPAAVLNAIEKNRIEKDRQKFLDQVISSESLMKDAQRLAHLGSLDIDLKNNIVNWSEELYHILGYEVGKVEPSLEKFLRRVHPDELELVKSSIEYARTHLDSFPMEFRLQMEDGSVKYIDSELLIERDEAQNAVHIKGFNQDITERAKILQDIVQRNKDLEQFSHIISHNLRAPVANILGISSALENEDLEADLKKELIEGLSLSVKKIDDVIIDLNNILQVKHQLSEKKELVQFSDLVKNIQSGIQNQIEKENAFITYDFIEADEMLTVKSYLHSIFYNLISNSLKYHQPGISPVIQIRSRKTEDKIELLFKDNGMGIDLETKRDQVFGLYKRFHTGIAEGKGMGLYMVKTQVETMGGKISVSSHVNQGTEFKIEFPTYYQNENSNPLHYH